MPHRNIYRRYSKKKINRRTKKRTNRRTKRRTNRRTKRRTNISKRYLRGGSDSPGEPGGSDSPGEPGGMKAPAGICQKKKSSSGFWIKRFIRISGQSLEIYDMDQIVNGEPKFNENTDSVEVPRGSSIADLSEGWELSSKLVKQTTFRNTHLLITLTGKQSGTTPAPKTIDRDSSKVELSFYGTELGESFLVAIRNIIEGRSWAEESMVASEPIDAVVATPWSEAVARVFNKVTHEATVLGNKVIAPEIGYKMVLIGGVNVQKLPNNEYYYIIDTSELKTASGARTVSGARTLLIKWDDFLREVSIPGTTFTLKHPAPKAQPGKAQPKDKGVFKDNEFQSDLLSVRVGRGVPSGMEDERVNFIARFYNSYISELLGDILMLKPSNINVKTGDTSYDIRVSQSGGNYDFTEETGGHTKVITKSFDSVNKFIGFKITGAPETDTEYVGLFGDMKVTFTLHEILILLSKCHSLLEFPSGVSKYGKCESVIKDLIIKTKKDTSEDHIAILQEIIQQLIGCGFLVEIVNILSNDEDEFDDVSYSVSGSEIVSTSDDDDSEISEQSWSTIIAVGTVGLVTGIFNLVKSTATAGIDVVSSVATLGTDIVWSQLLNLFPNGTDELILECNKMILKFAMEDYKSSQSTGIAIFRDVLGKISESEEQVGTDMATAAAISGVAMGLKVRITGYFNSINSELHKGFNWPLRMVSIMTTIMTNNGKADEEATSLWDSLCALLVNCQLSEEYASLKVAVNRKSLANTIHGIIENNGEGLNDAIGLLSMRGHGTPAKIWSDLMIAIKSSDLSGTLMIDDREPEPEPEPEP